MSQFSLLATRRFWPLFLTQFLGALNDNVFRFALVIFITFHVSMQAGLPANLLVVLSGGIFILPFFLFSALAGQLADKHEKAWLIRRTKLLEIGVMCLGALGFYLQSMPLLLAVLFLMGTQSAFFGPLKYGILPQHLTPNELTGGNALIQMATYIAILGGAAIGGLLAAWSGESPLPAVTGVLGVALLGYWSACRVPSAAPSDESLQVDWRLHRATWAVLREALATPANRVLLLTISWFWFLGATFLSLVPGYGKALLNADEQAVTLLNAAFTIGIGLGSLACERLSRGRIEPALMLPAALGISLCGAGVFLLGLPLAPEDPTTLANFFQREAARAIFFTLVALGACGAIYVVPLTAALQAAAAPTQRARIIGGLNILNALFMVGSALYTALLLQFELSLPAIFLITAGLNVLVMLAAAHAEPAFWQRLRARLGAWEAETPG
ncbi:MAG: MFS transporter [Gammaproteobacteria bacterium]|nr:MFS transporter [Gammaproteobacteria bacterium]